MADYATTKIVKTLRFPGDTNNQYQINAVKLDGHTYQEIAERLAEIESFDALRYMGTIAASSTSPGGLTPKADKGDVYKVTSKGYVMGAKVEVGDMLICNADDTSAATSSTYTTVAAKWDIIQSNIDVDAILAHKHTGTVSLTKTAKTLSHTVTPTQTTLTTTFTSGTASVTGNHGHSASGSFDYTPAGSVGSKSVTPKGSVTLTTPTSAATGDATITPSGTIANSTTKFVTGVTVSEHAAHTHTATFGGTAVAAHKHTVTLNSYTPEGSVASHKHDVTVTPSAAAFFNTATYSGSGDDGIITFGTANAVTSVSVDETSKAPTFTGTAKAPTTKSVSEAGGHTPAGTVTIENATVDAHTVTAPTADHNHTFSGNNVYVHAAFTGTSESHTHNFTGTPVTDHPVDVTIDDFTGNFTGTASGTVTPSVSKVLTSVTIGNHSIETVDFATVTTGNGTQD